MLNKKVLLNDIIDTLDRLLVLNQNVPKKYWDYFENCIVTYNEEYNVASVNSQDEYKYTPYAIIIKKGKEKYYFLAENDELTRDVKKAKIFFNDNIDFTYFRTVELWNAQKILNEEYPLPRKAISKKVRKQVYDKYNGHCAYCGREISFEEMQVDHIESHMGNCGIDDISNYNPSCALCNRVKSAMTLNQFKIKIKLMGNRHRHRKKPMRADSDLIAEIYGIDKEAKEIIFYFEK